MNRNITIFAVAAILVAASVGTGFALTYMSTTTSRNNEVNYQGITLDVEDSSGQSLGSHIPIVGPNRSSAGNNITHISGGHPTPYYNLVVNCPSTDAVSVQCWIILAHPENWAIIDSISLSISVPDGDGTVTKKVVFTQPAESNRMVGSVPSDALLLGNGEYSFKVDINYREINLNLDEEENTNFLNLSGSYLTFSAGLSNPVPGTTNPWVTVA